MKIYRFADIAAKRMPLVLLLACGLGAGCFAPARAGTLTDLGFPDGVVLTGPGASQTVYFHLPVDTRGATLNLRFAASAALDPHSSLTVTADGVPLATLPDAAAGQNIPIAVPGRFTRGRFLQLTFTADQTIDDDSNCYNNNNPADWTRIEPATALLPVSTSPQGVGAVWDNLATPLTIALPAHPSLADDETALILTTALVERGIAPYLGNGLPGASIDIDPTQPGLALGFQKPQATELVVPSPGAARALIAASGALETLGQSTATGSYMPNPPITSGVVTLGELGAGPASILVGGEAHLDLSLPLSALPAGRHPVGLVLYGKGAALAANDTEVISLEVGGNVIWSAAYKGNVALDGVDVDLPEALLASGARVELHIVRLAPMPACTSPLPLRFTLQDNTELKLSAGNPAPRRFAAFSVASNGPVPVLTDLPPESLTPALPLLAELLGAAGANPLALALGPAQQLPTAPFILVSHQANPLLSVAPIPQLGASITLPLPNQNIAVTLPEAGAMSVLQLVDAGAGASHVPGLWLSPGPAPSLAQAALPGDGNVAFYDGSPAPATYVTLLHDAVFLTVKPGAIATLYQHWHTELFGLLWLILLVIVVVIFVGRRRRGK